MSIQDVIDGRSRWCVVQGDVLSALDVGPVFDAVLCDPPYELTSGGKTGFMGQRWDGSGVSFRAETWARVLSHCKPGAPLMAFGGTRTFHRMTCAIEDSGWDIRDCLAEFFSPDVAAEAFLSSLSDAQLKAFDRAFHSAPNMAWVFGSGFPKSLNVSAAIDKATSATSSEPSTDAAKQWQGYGTALKPAYEPIVLARKPLDGTVANNCQAHGCGALAIDASRIEGAMTGSWGGKQSSSIGFSGTNPVGFQTKESPIGRWPANLLLDADSAALLDEQSGELTSNPRAAGVRTGLGYASPAVGDGGPAIVGSTGGASRFFYTSKASRTDRDHGLTESRSTRYARSSWVVEVLSQLLPASAVSSLRRAIEESTTQHSADTAWSTCWCGSPSTDPFHPAFRSIIETRTSSIMRSVTWSFSTQQHTNGCTAVVFSEMASGGSLAQSAQSSSPWASATGISTREGTLSTDDAGAATSVASWLQSKPEGRAPQPIRNDHTTVKPTDLIEYLARLILPPKRATPRLLYVPFAGSGSEMIGALRAGWDGVIGVEMNYADLAIERLTNADTAHQSDLFVGKRGKR